MLRNVLFPILMVCGLELLAMFHNKMNNITQGVPLPMLEWMNAASSIIDSLIMERVMLRCTFLSHNYSTIIAW